MVGDKDLQLTQELYSDPRLIRIFFDAAIAIDLRAHVAGTPREIRDDHKPFLAAGIPSVDLIDFEYGPGNDYWHSKEDRLDKCSVKSLEIIGRIVLQALPALEGFAYSD
jgi:glutaminyl-peptide cyclotransferase